MFVHATKMLTIKNLHNGKVENIRSKHNYFRKDEKAKRVEEQRIKKEFEQSGAYKVLKVTLSC